MCQMNSNNCTQCVKRAFKNCIVVAQYEFMPNRSTSTNLMQLVSECTSSISKDIHKDCIYNDLKAAFDSVSIDILIAKLDRLGFQAQLLSWLRSYLMNRTYYVQFGKTNSEAHLGFVRIATLALFCCAILVFY